MKLRTLFRLFLLLAAVAPITTAKADSLIIGRLDLHWLDDTPLDELARDDRAFEKKNSRHLFISLPQRGSLST
jgi:hypothetical protein